MNVIYNPKITKWEDKISELQRIACLTKSELDAEIKTQMEAIRMKILTTNGKRSRVK